MKTLVLISLLLLGTVAACVACRPATEEAVVSGDVGEVEVTRDVGKAGSTPGRPLPTRINTLAPEEIPKGVSPALVQDAQMYAADNGVELSEAIGRAIACKTQSGSWGQNLKQMSAGHHSEVSGFSMNRNTASW